MSKKIEKKKSEKKKMPKMARNTILIAFFIGFSALVYYFFTMNINSTEVKIMTLPLIETNVYSTDDGQKHSVKTNISYSMNNSNSKKYDEEKALEITKSTLQSLDYNKLREPSGTTYLKQELENNIAMSYPEMVDEDFNVYVSGYDLGLINGYLPGLIVQEKSSTKLETMFGSN